MKEPSKLEQALDELAQAHGQAALAEAFSRVRTTVRRQRREAKRTASPLADAVLEGVAMRDKMIAEGTPMADVNAAMEALVRDVWPNTRVWKYTCNRCGDTGLEILTCRKGERCDGVSTRSNGPKEPSGNYQRLCAMDPESDYEHDYGVPCFCSRGDKFRPKNREQGDGFEQATKSKPTRFGR